MCDCAVPIRTAKQIEGSRRACHIARTILDKAHAAIRPGITTDDIDRVVSHSSPLCWLPQYGAPLACTCIDKGGLSKAQHSHVMAL